MNHKSTPLSMKLSMSQQYAHHAAGKPHTGLHWEERDQQTGGSYYLFHLALGRPGLKYRVWFGASQCEGLGNQSPVEQGGKSV